MEKKNRVLFLFTVVITVIIVFIATVIKVYNTHIDNLFLVVESEITESAKRCFLESICTGNETTLGFLIEKEYLDRQIHPLTKEYISEDLKIYFDGTNCTLSID